MAVINPFLCIRPNIETASKIAALPYDVYNREEAKQEVLRNPLSFLKIDRAETQLDDCVDLYDKKVYEKAKETLDKMILENTFVTDSKACYYIYELVMNGRSQTGIVGCASIDDYLNNIIKKHENTREDKELDRIRHIDICNAQTGPIFLAYRSKETINQIIEQIKQKEPLYYFTTEDKIEHHVWRVWEKEKIEMIQKEFQKIENIYIADGHHRAASAVKVGLKRRKENQSYTKEEEYNFFLSVLFAHDELMIMSYNRIVKDLNGYSKEEFLKKAEENFSITKIGKTPFSPNKKGTFGMFLEDNWYQLEIKEHLKNIADSVAALDVSILQDYILNPILDIKDPRTDKRIGFVGGIRGLKELERRVKEDMKVAFALYPTSILELFTVADEEKLMPPKSTWFEPKLRSGLFIHKI